MKFFKLNVPTVVSVSLLLLSGNGYAMEEQPFEQLCRYVQEPNARECPIQERAFKLLTKKFAYGERDAISLWYAWCNMIRLGAESPRDLHGAMTCKGCGLVADFLVKYGGVDVNAVNADGKTPVHCLASSAGDSSREDLDRKVAALRSAHADMTIQDKDGNTPIDSARALLQKEKNKLERVIEKQGRNGRTTPNVVERRLCKRTIENINIVFVGITEDAAR